MTAATFVGANAGVTGNNASLAPTIHASAVAGDAMALYATIRNTAAVVVPPAGWAPLYQDGNVAVYCKEHSGTESAPTVTFTGGSAGDDTLAQIAVLRTVALDSASLGVKVGQTNSSAQNIALPSALTPNRNGSVVLVFGWKQDDWTSVATLSTMTEIGETIATAGSDAGQVWDYRIDTTAAATPAGPLTVTGGTSQISKSVLLALPQKAAITVDEQDVFPPRVLVSVTNVIVGDSVIIYREVAGERTVIRGGSTEAIDTAVLRVDAELPFGVPVTYIASVNGVEYSAAATAYDVPGGKVALTDAVTGDAAEVVIWAWPDRRYVRQSTAFKVGGRNTVVSQPLRQFEGSATFYTETQSAGDNLLSLLKDATSGIVQVRAPDVVTYDRVDCFIAVTNVTERRLSQDGSDPRRLYDVDFFEVEGWAPALEAQGFTLQDLADAYVGLTLADLAADYATLLLLAQADLS